MGESPDHPTGRGRISAPRDLLVVMSPQTMPGGGGPVIVSFIEFTGRYGRG